MQLCRVRLTVSIGKLIYWNIKRGGDKVRIYQTFAGPVSENYQGSFLMEIYSFV